MVVELHLVAKVVEELIQRSRKKEVGWSLIMTSNDGDQCERSMRLLRRASGGIGAR